MTRQSVVPNFSRLSSLKITKIIRMIQKLKISEAAAAVTGPAAETEGAAEKELIETLEVRQIIAHIAIKQAMIYQIALGNVRSGSHVRYAAGQDTMKDLAISVKTNDVNIVVNRITIVETVGLGTR